jgi:hypothetical protein
MDMTTGTAAYVAPARYALTELHRPDPAAGPCVDGEGTPCTGRTVCGEFMGTDELWVPVERRDGDQVCAACAGLPELGYVQEAML